MLSSDKTESILKTALSSGGDFAEVFFESKDELNIKCSEKVISGITTTRISGTGIYVLSGTKSVYVYTNTLSFMKLIKLAKQAAELIKIIGCHKLDLKNIVFFMQKPTNPNKFEIYPSSVSYQDKINVIHETDAAARGASPSVRQLNVDYFDSEQNIVIANSEGLYSGDYRVISRLRLQATVGNDSYSQYGWGEFTRPQGFEAFRIKSDYINFSKTFIKNLSMSLNAVTAPSCSVPVVFESGSCGAFWHETCGHQLEASSISRNSSNFAGMIGQKVASEKVTLIDDGTISSLYGSAAIDDEGHRTQKNILIENGILKGYLCDRLGGRKLNMPSTGSGRRQGYTYAPTARMSNTYLAAGTDDNEEMIRSIDKGLYVKRIGGGTGGREFSLAVSEGYWIKNGQIDHRVKGLVLNGRGIDVIKRVDRVGKNLQKEGGSFCGAASGLCTVTSFQPRMRISCMAVGGEE